MEIYIYIYDELNKHVGSGSKHGYFDALSSTYFTKTLQWSQNTYFALALKKTLDPTVWSFDNPSNGAAEQKKY